MTKPAPRSEEFIASDDPTWIIDTRFVPPQETGVHARLWKQGRLRRWMRGGVMLVAALGANHLVADVHFQRALDGAAVTDWMRIDGPASTAATSRGASACEAAARDVPREVRSPGATGPERVTRRVDAASHDPVTTQSDALAPEAKSPPFVQPAQDVPVQMAQEPNEAEQKASSDDDDDVPSASVRRTLERGRRLLKERRFTAASIDFRRVLAKRGGHPAALCGLARVALARGKLDDAKTFAERCVKRAPHQAAYHIVLGDVLRRLSQTGAADAEYRRASLLNPSRPVDSLPNNPF